MLWAYIFNESGGCICILKVSWYKYLFNGFGHIFKGLGIYSRIFKRDLKQQAFKEGFKVDFKVDLTGDFKKHSKDSFGGEGDRGMACRGLCVLANETVGIPLGMVVQ